MILLQMINWQHVKMEKMEKKHSNDAEYFAKGDIDEKKHQIVNINAQYRYTYKNMETGSNQLNIFFFLGFALLE